ncbi:hypothetical protein [Ferruginibacter sp. SUN106]|uniref:hypothetical protein n=1 Tax=Ferruginibacter sp. SUN106 TaxID=2978348 RepID=UPI003D35D804
MANDLLFAGDPRNIRDKEIQEMKEMLQEQHGREFFWEESRKAIHDLQILADISLELMEEEWIREEKLKEFPKGYHLDENSYRCKICEGTAKGDNSWYDKYGIKCMICQNAINEKIIPAALAKNKESWYSTDEMESYFNITGPLLNKYIKQGLIKERVILNPKNKRHLQLFLLKDNKEVLPPKKLLESRIVTVDRKGEEYLTLEYWYEYPDVKLIKKLLNYGIFDCLGESFALPIKGGSLYIKSVNPLFSYKK